MTDYWSQKSAEGVLATEPVIGWAYAGDTSVAAWKGVRSYTTSAANKLLVMLATTRAGWGIALKTVGTAGLAVPVFLRGIIKLKSAGSTMDKAQYFDSSGELLDLADQACNESGSDTYTIYFSAKVARALQTLSDNDYGLYYFNP